MSSPTMPIPTRASDDNHYPWGEGCDGWRLVCHPELSLREERLPPATAETAHRHHRAHQIFYVLAGAVTIRLPGQSVTALPGDAVDVPPGVAHLVENSGAEDLRLLLFSAPDTAGDRHPVTLRPPAV